MELTDKAIKALAPPETGQQIHWDATVKGFGLRITKAGAKAFILITGHPASKQRITIGRSSPAWNTKQARDHAASLQRDVDTGHDPMAERHKARSDPTIE